MTPFSARLAEKLGARVLISADLVLMATGLLILGVVASSAPVWALAVLFNGRLMARSPLNDLEEPELLRLGVEGKGPAGVRCALRRTPTALTWARHRDSVQASDGLVGHDRGPLDRGESLRRRRARLRSRLLPFRLIPMYRAVS